ncbi:MAG: methylated-DNA--[protein]-cysteine S-methyltransferase [candidate division WOR-3 bacterium]
MLFVNLRGNLKPEEGSIGFLSPVGLIYINTLGGVTWLTWDEPILFAQILKFTKETQSLIHHLGRYFFAGEWDFSWFEIKQMPRFYLYSRQNIPRTLEVYEYLRRAVPPGSVITYKELSEATGIHPRGIGSILRSNPWPIIVPCHRVIGSNGSLVGYAGGLKKKRWLLRLEGYPLAT